jgi:hypothetical protein
MIDTFGNLDTINITVWTRSYDVNPGVGKQTELLSRMNTLQNEGIIDTLSVRVWGKYVATTVDSLPETAGPTIRSRVAEFWSWADQNEYNLEPAFRRREMTTLTAEASTNIIDLPMLCLEVRNGERLVVVSPCQIDGETYSAVDCVDQLESLGTRRGQPDPASR